jgi:Arc/MetJ-type ribon-helix-helix transcriptional regulator
MEKMVKHKATYTLPAQLIIQIKRMVDSGIAPSQTAFVEQALKRELKIAKAELLRKEFEQAAHDLLFLRDIESTMKDFESADAQTMEMMSE